MSAIPDALDVRAVRELGQALIERARAMEEVGRRGRVQLTEQGVKKLAEILSRGDRPTVGFYRRHRLVGDD